MSVDYDSDIDYDDEDIYEEEQKVVAPRIMAGQEERVHWSAENAYGLSATTAEGEMGKRLLANARMTRTPEERFGDNVTILCRKVGIDNATRDQLLRLIPRIPDIRYKNPAGCLLGLMAYPYLGKKLTDKERAKFDIIMELVKTIKSLGYKIGDYDVVRYARMYRAHEIL